MQTNRNAFCKKYKNHKEAEISDFYAEYLVVCGYITDKSAKTEKHKTRLEQMLISRIHRFSADHLRHLAWRGIEDAYVLVKGILAGYLAKGKIYLSYFPDIRTNG